MRQKKFSRPLIYLGVLVCAAILGLVFVLHFSLKEKPVSKIKLSHFSKPQQVSESLVKRLYLELKAENILFLGVNPLELKHADLVVEFIKEAKKQEILYEAIFVESELEISPRLREQLAAIPLDIKVQHDQVTKMLQANLQSPEKESSRFLFVLPSVYVSGLIKNNPIDRLKNDVGTNFTSISFVPLKLNPQESVPGNIPCYPEGTDYMGTAALGCAIDQRARIIKKSRIKDNIINGQLDLYGRKDYLFFLRF